MRLLAVRFTQNIDAVKPFYIALGLRPGPESRTETWHELNADGGIFALHSADKPEHEGKAGTVGLSFEADEKLESIKARLDDAGFTGAEILDEAFGRSLQIVDPEGVPVQVNESDTTLYE